MIQGLGFREGDTSEVRCYGVLGPLFILAFACGPCGRCCQSIFLILRREMGVCSISAAKSLCERFCRTLLYCQTCSGNGNKGIVDVMREGVQLTVNFCKPHELQALNRRR